MVILPQSSYRKIVYYSSINVNFLVGKNDSVKQKELQHLHMLTYDEYME